jgi:hypothetical protein
VVQKGLMMRFTVILLGLLHCGMMAAAAQIAPESKLGLVAIAEPARAAVKPGGAIVLRVTLRNTSAQAFRLPDTVLPAPYDLWYLKLQDTATGKSFTGVSRKPMGASPEPGEVNPQLMQPGETVTVNAAFADFAFVEGDMGFQDARNIWFPQRLNGGFVLPAGTYSVRVGVRFRSFPSRPNLPPEIQAAQRAIDNDPVPVWKGDEILTSSTQITVNAGATLSDVERIQIARGMSSGLLQLLDTVQKDASFYSLLTHAGLRNDLRVLGDAARAVKADEDRDVRVINALTQAVTRSQEISQRSNESPEDRASARRLAARLRGFATPIIESAK